VSACKGGYIEKTLPEEYVGDGTDSEGNKIEEMEPGLVKELNPGQKFVEHDPKHPNAGYGPFVKTALRGAASGMMLSYTSFGNDLEGVNYSSIRAGVLEDREEFKSQQADLIEDLCEVVFERWLRFAILSGQVDSPITINDLQRLVDGQTWQGRRWTWVDPLKDINAAVVAIENRLESRTGVVGDNGDDFEDLLEEIAEEEALAKQKGVELPQVEPPLASVEPEEPGEETPAKKPKKKRWFFRK
jgi:lambda family phage portal protein